jgi:outer membrane immunogenic protein
VFRRAPDGTVQGSQARKKRTFWRIPSHRGIKLRRAYPVGVAGQSQPFGVIWFRSYDWRRDLPSGAAMQKLVVLLATLAFSGSAYAADMVVKAPPSPVPAAAANWTGFYIGGEGGVAWSRNADTWTANDPISAAIVNGTNGTPGEQPLASPYNVNRNGAVAGLELGYNWQVDPRWVVGVEADFSGAGIRGSGGTSSLLGSAGGVSVFDNTSSSQNTDWYGTVRGRLGWLATPNLLIFGTAGLAYGKTDQSANFVFGSNINAPIPGAAGGFTTNCATNAVCYSGSSSTTQIGWAMGGGIEWLFNRHWSAKVEYQFVDLGSETLRVTAPAFPGTLASSFNVIFRDQINVVRLGVNYKL